MAEKKAVARETGKEYRKAAKKGKALIPGRFGRLTGYNRKHVIRALNRKETAEAVPAVSGGTVKLKSGEEGAAKEPAGEDGPHPGEYRFPAKEPGIGLPHHAGDTGPVAGHKREAD